MPSKSAEKNVEIAKRASSLYPGAPVSQPQLNAILQFVKSTMRSGILKHLKCSEPQLLAYASGDMKLSDLDDTTRERLSNTVFSNVYSKPWPRKTAAMLFAINESRSRKRK